MLINLRNALMAGKRLPYDAEVEYLESTGEQYVNTGILASAALNDAQIDITYSSSSTSGDIYIFGGGNTFNTAIQCVINSSSNYFQPSWGQSLAIADGYAANAVTTLRMTYDDYALAFNTTTKTGSFTATSRTLDDRAIYLFRGNRTSGGINTKPVRIYAFKISRNGIPILDLIPVRKGTVGYMYDRVSGKFAERNGEFICGPDVVPVEYIESHGTEWIDTGVIGYKTTKIESSCALKNATTAYPAMWGARTNSYINDFQVYYQATSIGGIPTSIILRTGNSQKEISMSDIGASTLIGTRLNVIVADGTIYVNDRAFTTPAFSNFTTPHSILAFCQYSSRPANQGAFVYWGLKMWQGESLIRSFLPVRVGTGSTWEGAMMDVLTRRIYRNAGTGAFTYGNDLKYPIPAE